MLSLDASALITSFLVIGQIALASDSSIKEYKKAFGSKKKINLSAIFTKDYAEIRWDPDSDGRIDKWVISKGNLLVSESFKDGMIQKLVIQQKRAFQNITIVYSSRGKNNLDLIYATALPFKKYLNQHAGDDFFSEDSACPLTPIQKVSNKPEWADFISRTNEAGRKQIIQKKISPECKKLMNSSEADEFLDAAYSVFQLNFDGYVEDNKLLNCLANNSSTEGLLPLFLRFVGPEFESEPGVEISCEPDFSGKLCGDASYKNGKMVIPIARPQVRMNMTSCYKENFTHEAIHGVTEERLDHQSVRNIVKGCLENDAQALREVASVDYQEKTNIFEAAPVNIQNGMAEAAKRAAPQNTERFAADQVSLGNQASDRGSSLNSDFGDPASKPRMPASVAMNESLQRTSAVLNRMDAIAREFVPDASASTATVWITKGSGAVHVRGSVPKSVSLPDHDTSGFGGSVTSGDKEQSLAKVTASTVGSVSKSSAKPSREVASTGGNTVGNHVAPGVSAKNLDLGATPEQNDQLDAIKVTLTPAQSRELQQTVQYINSAKTPKEFEDRLAKANEKFKTLSVYVLAPRAGSSAVYGYTNAEAAAAKYSVIKNKLVKE